MNYLKYKYIAHRGLHGGSIPENSTLAFKRALEYGYAIELDVNITKDNKVIVFHDNTLFRMCGVNKKVRNCTFGYIKTLQLNNTKYKIPILKEVLKLINGKVPLIIELKNEGVSTRLEKNVLKIMKEYDGEYIYQSFNPFSILYMKNKNKKVKTALLSSNSFKNLKSFFMVVLTNSKLVFNFVKADIISYKLEDINNKVLKRYKNIPLFTWTISNMIELKEAKKVSDGIIFENILPKL